MFLSERLTVIDLTRWVKFGPFIQYFDWPLLFFKNLINTGNGQSKNCINGPRLTHVVRSIIVSLFDKNIFLCLCRCTKLNNFCELSK